MAHSWITAAVLAGNEESAAGRSGAHGRRTLRFAVRDTPPGSRVVVDVRVSLRGRTGACRTSFRLAAALVTAAPPTQAAAPPSPPAAPAPAPTPTPRPTAASCYPLSDEGTCYEPGEFCRDSDHGMSGVAGNGEKITCEDNDGWRWEPA